jgi:hypothetical protein
VLQKISWRISWWIRDPHRPTGTSPKLLRNLGEGIGAWVFNREKCPPVFNREKCLRALGQVRERGFSLKRGRGEVGQFGCVI